MSHSSHKKQHGREEQGGGFVNVNLGDGLSDVAYADQAYKLLRRLQSMRTHELVRRAKWCGYRFGDPTASRISREELIDLIIAAELI